MSEAKKSSKNQPAVLSVWRTENGLDVVGGMEEERRHVEDGIFNTITRWKNEPQNNEISEELTSAIKCVVDQGFGIELIASKDSLGKAVQLSDISAVGGFVDDVIHLKISPLTSQRKFDKNYGAQIVAQSLIDKPSLQYRVPRMGTVGVFRPEEVVLIQVYDTSLI